MNKDFPTYFRFAIKEARKSSMREKVGACLVVGKSIFKGYNKDKTHTEWANPNKHIRHSVHAEIAALMEVDFEAMDGVMYVYREVHGYPAMARPCEHCLPFLTKAGVKTIFYSTPEFPFWRKEKV